MILFKCLHLRLSSSEFIAAAYCEFSCRYIIEGVFPTREPYRPPALQRESNPSRNMACLGTFVLQGEHILLNGRDSVICIPQSLGTEWHFSRAPILCDWSLVSAHTPWFRIHHPSRSAAAYGHWAFPGHLLLAMWHTHIRPQSDWALVFKGLYHLPGQSLL